MSEAGMEELRRAIEEGGGTFHLDPGVPRPRSTRRAAQRIAEALALHERMTEHALSLGFHCVIDITYAGWDVTVTPPLGEGIGIAAECGTPRSTGCGGNVGVDAV